MTHVDLIYFNAGGGHRAAAEALREVLQGDPSPWRVRLLNLFELLDPQQRFRRLTGMPPEELYNRRLARGWTLGMAQELKLLQAGIRLAHPQLAQRLQRHWERGAPDIAVSLVPNFNRSIAHGLRATGRDLPFVTVLTDLADLPPRFWIEPGTGQHVICGTDRALEQARAQGVPETRLHRVSGMILRPGFYRPPAQPRVDARRALGLDEHTPTGVVMFGGHGSSAMLRIAESLPKVPLILMCGHNRRLAEQLRALPAAAPRVVVGYTTEVADHLRLGDFFVGKPGPGSLSEALHCGLPVIVTRPSRACRRTCRASWPRCGAWTTARCSSCRRCWPRLPVPPGRMPPPGLPRWAMSVALPSQPTMPRAQRSSRAEPVHAAVAGLSRRRLAGR